MKNSTKRTNRERTTVEEMIKIYCHDHHHTKNSDLCPSCGGLKDYAFARIEKCVFNPDKPNCKNCTIHCYSRQKKEEIRDIMRYSGPRMMLKKPGVAIMHLIDGLKDEKRIREFLEAKEKRKSNN